MRGMASRGLSRYGRWRLPRLLHTKHSPEADYDTRKDDINLSWFPPIASTRSPQVALLRVPHFNAHFSTTDFAQWPQQRSPDFFRVEGRVGAIRKSGKGMYFIDLYQDDAKVQIVATNKLMGLSRDEFEETHGILKTGDCIGVEGQAGRTNTGELSLKARAPVAMLAPALRLPNKLSDKGLINANRALYYRVDPQLKQPIVVKSELCREFRRFFDRHGFLEVQTPILSGPATGANARGFHTTDIHGTQLLLRVAPELWLKKLVIGGFDKVFEIGCNFRNEGIDATHNPEFTLCEFYQSYTLLDELMLMTEQLFAQCQQSLQLPALDPLTRSYKRVEFIPGIEAETGHPLPAELTQPNLHDYCRLVGVDVKPTELPAQMLDALSLTFLEPISLRPENINHPVFIYHQPEAMSPLAKGTTKVYGDRTYNISLRFELFINGKEYVNAYEEENDPSAQERKFREQLSFSDQFGDDESLVPDWRYLEQMEYGLPPTGGWGCGIDRLAMLFAGCDRIEQVQTFGTVDDVIKQ